MSRYMIIPVLGGGFFNTALADDECGAPTDAESDWVSFIEQFDEAAPASRSLKVGAKTYTAEAEVSPEGFSMQVTNSKGRTVGAVEVDACGVVSTSGVFASAELNLVGSYNLAFATLGPDGDATRWHFKCWATEDEIGCQIGKDK